LSTESTPAPTPTTPILTTPTISSTPSVSSTPPITSTPQNGWKKYTVAEDYFEINVPITWTVTERDKSMMRSYFLDAVEVQNVKITPMEKVLYLTQPGSDITAIITGVELSSDNGPEISNSYYLRQFLKSVVPQVEKSMKADPIREIDGIQYENILSHAMLYGEPLDPTLYRQNGNNVMRAEINFINERFETLTYTQIYVIQNKNRIYFVQINYVKLQGSIPQATEAEISTLRGSLNILP